MNKKILMIGMNSDVGGIESYIMNVYRKLGEDYTLYFPYVNNMAYENEIVSLGGKIIRDVPRSRRNPFKYYSRWISIFKKYQFDAIYFNNCDIVNVDLLKMAKRAGVPVRVFHAHSSSNTLNNTGFIHRIEEKRNRNSIDKIATDLLACSKNAGDFMFGGLPYKEINNGIDVSRFEYNEGTRNKKRKELNLESKKVIMFVGRFIDIKNPLYAIDVVKECNKIDSDFVGLICGDGQLMQAAKEKVAKENLGDFVKLMGNCAGINELYSVADILIMPSLFEGFPFVLVEAECSGLKCICSTNVETNTNLIGTVEYLPLEIGADGWAQAISGIDLLYNRNNYRQVIQSSGYDIDKTVEEIKSILNGKVK